MTDPSYVTNKALYARFVAYSGLTDLVPATSILDMSAQPNSFPCIILGEAQVVDDGDIQRTLQRVYADWHIWTADTNLNGVKRVADQMRRALAPSRISFTDEGFECVDLRIENTRFLRDPDGEHTQGIVTFNALVREKWVLEA